MRAKTPQAFFLQIGLNVYFRKQHLATCNQRHQMKFRRMLVADALFFF